MVITRHDTASAHDGSSGSHDTRAPLAATSGRIPGRELLSDGVRISVELAPLVVPHRDTVVRAVRGLIALGPAARVGRTIQGNRWMFDPDALDEQAERMVRPLPARFAGDAGLPLLREAVDPDLPFTVFLGEDRASLCIDHRMGDGFLSVMVTAGVLAGRGAPGVFSQADDRNPLPAALTATFLRHPEKVVRLVRNRVGDRRPRYTGPTVAAGTGRLALITRRMESSAFRELADWSRGRVAPTVATIFALNNALRQVGIPVMDEGGILVDLRRYLPSGRSTLANFVVGRPVRLDAGVDAAGARFHQDLHEGRPLAALTAGLMTGSWRRQSPDSVPAAASPVVSDMGFLRALEPLPWASDDATVRVSVDPAERNGITALTAVLRRRLNISVSFDASMFDDDAIAAAAELLCRDPRGLLP